MPISPIPDRGFWDNSVPETERHPNEPDAHASEAIEAFPDLEDIVSPHAPEDQLFDQEAPERDAFNRDDRNIQPSADAGPRIVIGARVDDPAVENQQVAQYDVAPGMPARGVIVLSSLAGVGCAALDLVLTGGLSIFFDLCFVVICLVGAMGVRRKDLFTAGVLAPLVFAGTIAVVALLAPETFAVGGLSKIFLSGLAQHAGALVAGYGVALATVAGRVTATRPVPAA